MPEPTTELVSVADTSGVAAALEAAEKHAQIITPSDDLLNLDGPILVAHRNDRQIDTIDLERFLHAPVRPRGTTKALTADGFITSYKQFATHHDVAAVYANPDQCALIAVLNDDHHAAGPGWRDHRIDLALQTTPEWDHWYARQGLGPQRRFAETIEEGQDEIVGEPNATLMLEIAQEFTASIGGKFTQKGRLTDGTVQLVYEETVDAKVGEGLVPVPPLFTVRVRPFWGAEPRDIEARVRYVCRAGELQIGYRLHRPDEVKRDAFATDVLEQVRDALPATTVIEAVPAVATSAGR